MEKNKYQTRELLKMNLRTGDYQLIASVLNGEYTEGTVRQQLNGHRTLQQSVIDAANKVIRMREELITSNL